MPKATLQPHFRNLFDAVGLGRCVVRAKRGRIRFASYQSPICNADRSEATAQNNTSLGRKTMQKGTVKWFNPTKGYGFIRPSIGEKDVFVHISAVERAGLSTLNEGQNIEYELVTSRGKTSAENLRVS